MSKNAKDRANAKRIVAQQQAAARRRTVTIWTSAAVVVVLAIAGLVGWTVLSSQQKADAGRLTTPSVAVDEGTAFAVGTGPVVIDLYEDFMCPVCHVFETESGATMKQWVADKKVTIRYHPVAILNRSSNGTNYSTRASGAAAAAAIGGKFSEYHDVLYANQPTENSDGLPDAKLIELGTSVGLGDKFATAVRDKTYDTWADKVTDTFSSRGYSGTPTILVAGKVVKNAKGGYPSADQLTNAVTQAAG